MNHGFQSIKRIFGRIAGESAYDELLKQPIPDADAKLTLFNNISTITTNAFEAYNKSMSKSVDMTLKEKFDECQDQFNKYESKQSETLELPKNILLNIVLNKTTEVQQYAANEVLELTRSIEKTIVKTLSDYQKEVNAVKETRKELKNAYLKVDECKQSLDKSRKDVDNYRKQMELVRITNDIRKTSEIQKQLTSAEEKTLRCDRELDEAQFAANEKYDKYTEGLYKKVSEEHELANCYLEYLRLQQKYHYNVYKKLEDMIPEVKSSIHNYPKKPIFGCSIDEHIRIISNDSITTGDQVSPVIRKIIEAMIRQNAFNEEGLFRIAGSKVKMNRLISAINAGYLDNIDLNDYDIHCLASVLKQYLRDLPDSIMCNSLYEDWFNALNSPTKLDAFKQVLKKLPKTNYQNLKYIVRFLAGIVDNSEKTKMNANNIGICFGVSLLNTNSDSNKNIDMSTGTSAFDFILTNNQELFPENDVNFLPKVVTTSTPSNSSNNVASNVFQRSVTTPLRTERAFNQINTPSNSNLSHKIANSSDNETTIIRHSVMVPDSKYVGNDVKYRANDGSSNHTVRGHMKKNSLDFNSEDSRALLSPDVSNTTQSSPRIKTKKLAPAPPGISQSTNNENLSQVPSLFPKIDNSDKSQSSSILNNNNNSNNEKLLKSADSSSNLVSNLEKPTIAPPSVPVRPPPIGFKENLYNTGNSQTTATTITDTNTANNQTSITSSTSSTSSSELNSPTNTLNKPPKPVVPRKPVNLNNIQTNNNDDTIEANESINNSNTSGTNSNNGINTINSSNGSNKSNTDKPASEITSL